MSLDNTNNNLREFSHQSITKSNDQLATKSVYSDAFVLSLLEELDEAETFIQHHHTVEGVTPGASRIEIMVKEMTKIDMLQDPTERLQKLAAFLEEESALSRHYLLRAEVHNTLSREESDLRREIMAESRKS